LVSWAPAAVTMNASSSGGTSVAMCRLRPFIRFPPSYPCVESGAFGDALTDWTSAAAEP
jgi:hypothetical protein